MNPADRLNVPYQHPWMRMADCRHGTFLYNSHDRVVGLSLEMYGESCEAELSILRPLAPVGGLVLDVGAYIGTHTVFFSHAVGDQGVVIALEPQRLIFQNLCANLALNGILNVVALNLAAGRSAEIRRCASYDPRVNTNFAGIALTNHPEGENVEIAAIDRLGINHCDLMKVDVEGMEVEVLEGACKTIERFKPVLFIENNTVEGSTAILTLLDELGYDAWWSIFSNYNPQNWMESIDDYFSGYEPTANLLCHHRSRGGDSRGLPAVCGRDDDWKQAYHRLLSNLTYLNDKYRSTHNASRIIR
jgi:FkbM family methyltransferase